MPAGYIRIGRTYTDKCVVPAPNDPIPVQTMRLTDYLRGVLPNEWNAAWPAASLDAGAIAVKAYAWYNAVIQPKWSTKGYAFDLLDNTCDQYYRDNSADPRTDAALSRTWYTWVTRNGLLVPLEYRALETQCPALPGCMGQVQSAQFAGIGANAEAILRHYYAGVDVVQVPPPRPIYLPLVTR